MSNDIRQDLLVLDGQSPDVMAQEKYIASGQNLPALRGLLFNAAAGLLFLGRNFQGRIPEPVGKSSFTALGGAAGLAVGGGIAGVICYIHDKDRTTPGTSRLAAILFPVLMAFGGLVGAGIGSVFDASLGK